MELGGKFKIVVSLLSSLCASVALAASDINQKQVEEIIHNYLLKNPELLVEMSQRLQENRVDQFKQMEEKARKIIPTIATSLFNNSDSPVGLNPKGKITLVEFFDYQCQHCKDVTHMIQTLQKQNPELRVIYKELPIFGGQSLYAAKVALAAQQQQKYLPLHEALMKTTDPLDHTSILTLAEKVGLNKEQLKEAMKSKVIDKELKNNMELAQKLGITGTPSFILAESTNPGTNKEKTFFIPGATDKETLNNLIARVHP